METRHTPSSYPVVSDSKDAVNTHAPPSALSHVDEHAHDDVENDVLMLNVNHAPINDWSRTALYTSLTHGHAALTRLLVSSGAVYDTWLLSGTYSLNNSVEANMSCLSSIMYIVVQGRSLYAKQQRDKHVLKKWSLCFTHRI